MLPHRWSLASLIPVLLILLGAPPAGAYRSAVDRASSISLGDVTFYSDAVATLDTHGQTRVRVFLEAPWGSFRFLPGEGGYAATFQVEILVYDRSNDQISGDNWSVPLAARSLIEVQDPNRIWRRVFELEAAPGKVRCEVRLTQSETARTGRWESRLNIPDYADRALALSELVLGHCVEDSTEADPAFRGFRFVPGARRSFGDDRPVLCAYGEIYDRSPAADTAYFLTYDVLSAGGKSLETWTATVPRHAGRGRFCLHPSVAGLKLGDFRLRVEARLGEEKTRTERLFEVDRGAVPPLDDPHRLRALLGYIATNDELVRLESTPNDSLPAFWNGFWERRDPTPGTPKNENLDEFLRRVEYADAHFSVLESGWNSDMGRIYIRFGPPDQVDRAPLGTTTSNQEVWHYFARNLRFVFIDYDGFGRFRLAGSERG